MRTIQLGQVAPSDTNNTVLFSPSETDRCTVETIVVCNVTSSDAAYRIFHDEDGTTYSAATALFYDVPITGNTTEVLQFNIYMNSTSANLAVRSDTGSALTFTAYGRNGSVAY